MSHRIPIASLTAVLVLILSAPANVSAQSAPPQVAWQQATTTMMEGAQIQLILIAAWRTVDGVRVTNGRLAIPYTVSGNATPDVDYRLTPAGRKQLDTEKEVWNKLVAAVGQVLDMA